MRHYVQIPDEFERREDLRAWLLVTLNLAVVLGAGVLAWRIHAWWAYGLAFVLVGARGQASYILQHEAMHNLLFTAPRTNERVGILLSAILGTQFFLGRSIHWDHHRYVGQPQGDPNEIFHGVVNRPPGFAVARFFLFHLLGGRLLLMVSNLGQTVIQVASRKKAEPGAKRVIPPGKSRTDLLALFLTQAIILAAISILSSPIVYFALYLAPLATLTAFFEVIRSFSEHVLPGKAVNDAEENRRFFMDAGPFECFFISQFGFHYHQVHHLYPNVVTFKVAALHRWLLENDPDYPGKFMTRPGYVGTAVRYLFNRPFQGAGEGFPEFMPGAARPSVQPRSL